jgi:hypothetical protein
MMRPFLSVPIQDRRHLMPPRLHFWSMCLRTNSALFPSGPAFKGTARWRLLNLHNYAPVNLIDAHPANYASSATWKVVIIFCLRDALCNEIEGR